MCSCISLVDTRIAPSSTSTSLVIPDAHQSAVNHLQWAPGPESHLLLSSSFDPVVRIFDIRQPSSTWAELRGHTDVNHCKQIYQPQFVWGAHQCSAPLHPKYRLSHPKN